MKTSWKMLCLSCVLAVASKPCLAEGDGGTAVQEMPMVAAAATLNESLVARYAQSLVDVCFFIKEDMNGLIPPFQTKYLCPNCHEYHTRNLREHVTKRIPLVLPGFYLGDGRILLQDNGLRLEWMAGVEVRHGLSERAAAHVSAYFPDEGAMEVTLDSPLPNLEPLVFDGNPQEAETAFYCVNEDGMRRAGTTSITRRDVVFNVSLGGHFLTCSPNTLLLDSRHNPVSVSLLPLRKLENGFTAPDKWRRISAADFEAETGAMERRIADSVFPVTIHLEPRGDEAKPSRMNMYGGDFLRDGQEDSFDTFGLLLDDGNLLVFKKLTPFQTARFANASIALKDGTRRPASFVGSVRVYGRLVVKPESPLAGEPVTVADMNEICKAIYTSVLTCSFLDDGDKMDVKVVRGFADELKMGFGGNPVVSAKDSIPSSFVFTASGRLCSMPVSMRLEEDTYSYSDEESVSAPAVMEMLHSENPFDMFNVPRAKDERDRMLVNFGVHGQNLDKALIQSRKISRFFDRSLDFSNKGFLVSSVQPGSLAETIGVHPDDILLYFRSQDGVVKKRIDNQEDMFFDEEFPWEHYDELPEMYFDQIPQPWGTVMTQVNVALSSFGIGNTVVAGIIRGSALEEISFTLSPLADTFESAPRHRLKSMGIMVAALTPEVRSYFKIGEGEPGLVIAQVRKGSTASVAGLKPYEIITAVDGEPVATIDEFKKVTAKKTECNFTVRRLVDSRVVKVTAKVGPVK